MSKQKRNYNISKIRPTSYSHAYTSEQFEKQDNKIGGFYSNLLHNYEKVGKNEEQTHRITFLQLRKGSSAKIKNLEVEIKQLQRKLPFQAPFFIQKGFNSSSKKLSNYSLYLERSMSKQSRRTSHHYMSPSRTPETARSELLDLCKITSMKIEFRRNDSNLLKQQRQGAEFIRKRNSSKKKKMLSEFNLSKKIGEEIEPWGLKNYESIML